MEISADPVEAALDERRARRTAERSIETALTIGERCRDAAEQRLWVRVFVIGGTTVAGAAVAIDDHLLTVEQHDGVGLARRTHLALDAVVRITVAGSHARGTASEIIGGGTAVTRAVGELARRGSKVAVTTSDGSTLCGSPVSLGDRAMGFSTGQGRWIDWVDPSHVVAVAEAA